MKQIEIHTSAVTLPADLETPIGIYLKLRDIHPVSALLESSDYHTVQNSTSIIAIEPLVSFRLHKGRVAVTYPDGQTVSTDVEPLDGSVERALKEFVESFSFTHGNEKGNCLLGFTAYDAVRYFEPVSVAKQCGEFEQVPDMEYVFFRYVIRIDHFRNTLTLIENRVAGMPSERDRILALLRCRNVATYKFTTVGEAESPLTDAEYVSMVERGISHAKRGDVFQIVLSRRFSQRFEGDEFNVYRALRCVNPSPYLFFYDFGDYRIFGSSPETHLRIDGGTAYIDPIAGTFRRTGNDVADHELAEKLLADPKENAEHIMLVDLARNDLARSGGLTHIEFLRQVQYYSHVLHLVSRVSAKLPADADIFRLFAATFPAGTLSGAPKVRAMQLIDEIEPHARKIYGGCIGMIGFDGTLNQAITIRSFLSVNNRLYSQSGAGVVASSAPESELKETNNKLGALVSAVEYAKEF